MVKSRSPIYTGTGFSVYGGQSSGQTAVSNIASFSIGAVSQAVKPRSPTYLVAYFRLGGGQSRGQIAVSYILVSVWGRSAQGSNRGLLY